MAKDKPIKCSYCSFAIPKLNTTPLSYGCFSPYESIVKCDFGISKKNKEK